MMRYSTKQKGFTLVETLVALAVGLVVSLTVIQVSVSVLKSVRNQRDLERLHSNALYVVNALAPVIRQSKSFPVASGSTITLTMPDLSKKVIKQTGNAIFLDAQQLTTSDVQVLATPPFNMISTSFSIQLSFTMKSADGLQTFSATTTVARRNAL